MRLDFPYSTRRLSALAGGALRVSDAPSIFQVAGPGALTCLQGLFTADLAAPGEGSLSWGALLSPKGMILFDAWVLRDGERFFLVADAAARSVALELFRRTLPPRLAKLADLTDSHRAEWLLGGRGLDALSSRPHAGRVERLGAGPEILVAAGQPAAPFSAILLGAEGTIPDLGVPAGTADDLAAARILGGWPTLGREIDEKTLPQEVRFNELGGVSYSKGCYTGQETVARIHFRGHVNRSLRGIQIASGESLEDREVLAEGKPVGGVRGALLMEDRVLGLAMIRREVENGAVVNVAGRTARVMEFPLGPQAHAYR